MSGHSQWTMSTLFFVFVRLHPLSLPSFAHDSRFFVSSQTTEVSPPETYNFVNLKSLTSFWLPTDRKLDPRLETMSPLRRSRREPTVPLPTVSPHKREEASSEPLFVDRKKKQGREEKEEEEEKLLS